MLVPRVRAAAVAEVMAALNSGPNRPVGLIGPRGSGRSNVLRQVRRNFPNCMPLDVRSLMAALTESESPGLHAMLATGALAELLRVPTSRLSTTIGETRPPRPASVALALWQASQTANRAGRDSSVLWVIDDLDLLDPFSQAVVIRLAAIRAARGSGVLLAVAPGSNLETVADVEWIPLAPAGPLDVRHLVEGLVGFPLPWRVATRLAEATGGDLRAARSSVQLLDTDALRGLRLLPHPLPLDQRTAVGLMAGRSPDSGTGQVLAALAFEEQLPVDTARRLAGQEYPAAVADGTLSAAGGSVRAAAPAQALAAWSLIRQERRPVLHRLLASANSGPRNAVYRALASEQPDADQVCAATADLLMAGDSAGASLGLAALEHQVPPTGEALLAGLFSQAHFVDLAECLNAAATHAAGGPPEAVLSRWAGELSVLDGRADRPVPMPGPPPQGARPDQIRAWLEPMIAACRSLWQRDDFAASADVLRQVDEVAGALDDEGRALLEVARAEFAVKTHDITAGERLSAATRSWCAERQPGYEVGVSVTAYMLLFVGDLETAALVLRSGRPGADSGPLARLAHLQSRIHLAVAGTRYQSADQLLVEADQELPISAGGSAHLWGPQVEVIAALGTTPEREERAARFSGERSLRLTAAARVDVLAAEARRALVDDRFGEAAAILPQALAPGGAIYEPRTAVLADLLEAERASGADDHRMQALMDRYGDWLPDFRGSRFASLVARCEAIVMPSEVSGEAYRKAAELADERFPIDRARTLIAGARRHADQTDLAIDWLGRALAILEVEGLDCWAEHARRLRRRIDPDVGRPLTDLEQRIVELVLQGRANAEIARSLFISKRSLELQLTRIYRALGVRGKSELRAQHAAVG